MNKYLVVSLIKLEFLILIIVCKRKVNFEEKNLSTIFFLCCIQIILSKQDETVIFLRQPSCKGQISVYVW